MSNEDIIQVSIEPAWSTVKNINDQIIDLLPGKGQMIVDSVRMVTTELIENAVKYCEPTPDMPDIEFELKIRSNIVTIRVVNGVKTVKNADAVQNNIDKIRNSDDHAALYMNRLTELMENPLPGESQLGLYRIAYEGKFSLDYEFENNILTIIAERKL